jgi:hypothetical protein
MRSAQGDAPPSPKVHANARADVPLTAAVWDGVKDPRAKRQEYIAYYAGHSEWTPPPPLPVMAGRQRNLAGIPEAPRFPLTGKVWPGKPGEGAVCLWEDDKVAAMSVGIDDNEASDVPFWLEMSRKYGGLNITWNIIVQGIGGAHPGQRGTWERWQDLYRRGFHLASHSMTHAGDPVPDDGWPGFDFECAESQRLIDAHVPGHRTRMFVPGGTLTQEFNIFPNPFGKSPRFRESIGRYYTSGRTGGAQPVNQANKIDYLSIHATTAVEGIVEGPKFKPQLALANCLNPDPASPYHDLYRGWACVFIHWANQGKTWETNPYYLAWTKVLDFYNQHRGELWTGFADDVALYGQERDTATLTTLESSDNRIALKLTDAMDPTLFDYPLTLKVRLPDSWKGLQASQNGKSIPALAIAHEGANYGLVKALPDRGEIVLSKGTGR